MLAKANLQRKTYTRWLTTHVWPFLLYWYLPTYAQSKFILLIFKMNKFTLNVGVAFYADCIQCMKSKSVNNVITHDKHIIHSHTYRKYI